MQKNTIEYDNINSFITFFDTVGFYAPLLLFFIVCYHLLNQRKYLLLYILCFFANTSLNKTLKLIFREPRPDNPVFFSKVENYKNEEQFGMPSGHAQSVFFSLVYLYCIKPSSVYLLLFVGFVSLITLYQRWKYRRHTLAQLIIGSLVGGLFARCVYVIEKYINQ